MKKRLFDLRLIVLLLLTLSFVVTVYTQNKNNLPSGFIGYGLYDVEGKIIDNGDFINQDSSSNEFILGLFQDLIESREYLVLVFIDYIQTPFVLNNNKVMQYEISLNPNDTVNVPIKIDIPPQSKELSILIIKQPNFMVEKDDFGHAIKTENTISLRYSLSRSNDMLEYSQNYEISNEKPMTQLFLSSNPNELIIRTVEDANSKLYITLGNKKSDEIDYAIIALLNWQQTTLNSNMVNYYQLSKQSRIYFDFMIPNVEEDSNYQIVAFPYSFKVDIEKPETTFVYGTHRIHIKP